ncbi:MAG: peroxiredoxin [Gammaproteobacteria bacterium]
MFNLLNAMTIETGQHAPEFQLNDQHGKTHSLEMYRGQWVVLYFYPKNDTPGCTKQACAFRDEYKTISAHNTQILGVSVDSSESHDEFANKYHLPFPLLSDTQGRVAKQYNALTSLGFIKFAKRHTFIIDPDGKISMVYRNVDVSSHSDQILSDLKKLQSNNS